jgi:flagellar L-ring protein precursor FlgH
MSRIARIGLGLGLLAALLAGGCATDLAQPKPGDNPAYVATRPPPPPPEPRPALSRVPQPLATGSLYRAGYGMRLFEDPIARQVGDVLTILLTERTDAKKKAATDLGKDSKNAASVATNTSGLSSQPWSAELDLSADREFDGSGKSEQSNSLKGGISVVVSEVLSNGNLVVGGEKWITLNQGNEYIRISGIVRPEDIQPGNTVSSLLVADARISYGGTGSLAETNRPGWLARFFMGPIFPL